MSKFGEFLEQAKVVLPAGWHWVRLGDVCQLNPRRPAISRQGSTLTTFIPMSSLDEDGGGVHRAEQRPYAEVQKGYTYFEESDVIFAKITPCMQNGKHAVVRNLIDGFGFGSTEFHVLRPSAVVLADWIHLFLIQPTILKAAAARFTGAVGQQRVPEDFLANLALPLPPLHEQKRIIAVVTEQIALVDNARFAAEEQLLAARALPVAFLKAVFAGKDAVAWPVKQLGTVCEIVARQVDPKLPEFGVLPHVNGENIVSGTGRLKNVRSAIEDGMTSGKYLFEAGNVLYSKLRPYLRKVALANFTGLCSADMYPIRVFPDKLDAGFALWLLLSEDFTRYAEDESRRARMPKLNRDQLFAYEAAIPPLDVQRQLVTHIDTQMAETERVVAMLEDRMHAINGLPAELLARAFRGELSRPRFRHPVPKKITVQIDGPIQTRPVIKRGLLEATLLERDKERASLLAYFTDKQSGEKRYGRTKEVKLLNLATTHLGLPLGGEWVRGKFGPYDAKIRDMERYGRAKGWLSVDVRTPGRSAIQYLRGDRIDAGVDVAHALLGDKQMEMDRVISLFAPLNKERTELMATAHSAWNDLLLDGKSPTDDEIVWEVRENWHPSKQKFSPSQIVEALDWLKENGLTPRGVGPRTKALPQTDAS